MYFFSYPYTLRPFIPLFSPCLISPFTPLFPLSFSLPPILLLLFLIYPFTVLFSTLLFSLSLSSGLLMLGQSESPLAQTIIPDLLNYTHDTSHEKIVR